MCEHCDALRDVLTQLAGEKVAAVIMKRTVVRLHGPSCEQILREPLVVTV